mmetsp:Transcript_21229/g.27855  ORF Transcript_21229/g.27855 Transcript_21229/m.27855 type:complete len:228 (+) Transcript_21229:83-766(+)
MIGGGCRSSQGNGLIYAFFVLCCIMIFHFTQEVRSFVVDRSTLHSGYIGFQILNSDNDIHLASSSKMYGYNLFLSKNNAEDGQNKASHTLQELTAREASRNLENWIEACFQAQRDEGNDDPRGTYSDPIINLQQMQDWAISARFKSTKATKKLLFGLSEDQEELVGISCVDVDVTDASIPQPKIVHSALNPKVGVKKSDEGKSFIAEELEKLIQEFLLTQKKVEEII